MSTSSAHATTAQALCDAERNGVPILPLRDVVAPTDEVGAYAIQSINVQRRLDAGARLIGRKIGLTSLAVQRQLGVDQPDYGVLFDDMAVGPDRQLQSSRLIQPKVEAEIAIILGRDLLSAATSAADVAAAIDYAVVALEIVDSRIADWKITFADTIADNGSSAFFVLGDERRRIDEFDPVGCEMTLELNGDVVSQGSGAACLGNPLEAAAWLARTLVQRGDALCQGDIVLTGALGPMVPIKAGDKVLARVSGLGVVSCSVA